MSKPLVVGFSGASGVIYGIRLLEVLRNQLDIPTSVVMSAAAKRTIVHETEWSVKAVAALATEVFDNRDISAPIASGSYPSRGMVVVPCSVKTLSAIANSYDAELLTRAADVTLKEGRPLVLVLRETPLHLGHIRLMERAAENGAVLFPPVPEFYGRPRTLDDLVDSTVGRILLRLGIDNQLFFRWKGMREGSSDLPPPADKAPSEEP